MSTKIQRKVLAWMVDHGGEMLIFTGHKTTRLTKTKETQQPVIACSGNVLDGLRRNCLISPAVIGVYDHRYRITNLGIAAIAKTGGAA